MSDAKHTPGPWSTGTHSGHHMVALQDGRIGAYCGIVGADDDAESQANARLIAAAPDLLALAYTVESMIVDGGLAEDDAWAPVLAECRAAIAKAKGGTDE